MPAHLTEEEQIQALKRWWEDNGKLTLSVVILSAAGYFAWSAWQGHQASIAAEASEKYDRLAKLVKVEPPKALTTEQKAEAKVLAEGIVNGYQSSQYANLASLAIAKLAVEDHDFATAAQVLRRVMESASSDVPTQELARLRLAKVLSADGKTDEAVGLLSSGVSQAYEASYAEAKGDILLSANRLSEAFSAYQVALTAIDKPDANAAPMRRSILQFKMDSAREPGSTKNPLIPSPSVNANPHAGPNPSVKLEEAPAAGTN